MNKLNRGFVAIVLLSVPALGCKSGPARDATSASSTSDATAASPTPSSMPAPDAAPPAPPAATDPASSAPLPAEPLPPVGDPAAALRDMRAALDEIRAAAPDAEATNSRPLRTEVLVGMTRDAIRAALGAPSTCEEDVSFDQEGRGHPVAPCEAHQDWFYSFYHLPETWVGGGPELLLQFDANDVCSSARWMHTQ